MIYDFFFIVRDCIQVSGITAVVSQEFMSGIDLQIPFTSNAAGQPGLFEVFVR